jgi:hypothetical protein
VISLATALEAFIREHEYCGERDTRLEDGSRLDDTCSCGARLVRVPAFG